MSSSSSVLAPVGHDEGMDSSQPRKGGPTRRRSFTPAQKLLHLTDYEAACRTRTGGAYLRREGLHSSQITEWRQLRDSGVLAGKQPGDRIGRPTPEQAEIARLRRSLDKANQKLARTEVALEIMGKARELLEDLSSSSQPKNKDTNY
jgi:transposase